MSLLFPHVIRPVPSRLHSPARKRIALEGSLKVETFLSDSRAVSTGKRTRKIALFPTFLPSFFLFSSHSTNFCSKEIANGLWTKESKRCKLCPAKGIPQAHLCFFPSFSLFRQRRQGIENRKEKGKLAKKMSLGISYIFCLIIFIPNPALFPLLSFHLSLLFLFYSRPKKSASRRKRAR